MAENSHQNVVNQVQSTDASASVDVSAPSIDASAAPAATPNSLIPDKTEPAAPASDKVLDGAATGIEDENTSRDGRGNNSSLAATEIASENTGDLVNGDVSAPPSLGQSADSDTDISKHDSLESTGKGGDTPKLSVKKPSAFKSVSVTKNFLAKAGTAPTQLAKSTSENSTSTTPSSALLTTTSARPRLVAKTTSGHKLSMSTQLSNGVKSGRSAGPDPMQVWNRNRVQAPQATPKHLTDEELRQQYGIQLASIPVIDGDDKGNKWADIDDEEDDWAPEVIEWSDGSKVNLAEAEKTATEKARATEEAKRRDEIVKSQQGPVRTMQSLGPKATILKLGGASAQSKQGVEVSAASIRSADKPTLVAKPVASAPVKSPWAALPPVEKTPPVIASPAVSMASKSQTATTPEPPVSEHGPTGWRAAKEIAADDFSRIHRDAANGPPRELFNSHSGKYEPVGDARRGSMKRDQLFRQPAVLQRPAADHEIATDSVKDVESQSVSVHDDQQVESTHPPSDPHSQQPDQPQPWRRQSGHWAAQKQPGPQSPASISTSPAPLADAAQNSALVEDQSQTIQPAEDAVAVQKRLMQEKRQAAIKRRQEEEAREEAAKKERIRKKLESLPPPPEKKAKDKPETISPPKSAQELAPKNTDENNIAPTKSGEIPLSPPKPPAPGQAVQQYGMIKVHPSPKPKGVSPVIGSASAVSTPDATMERQTTAQEHLHHKHPLGDAHAFSDHRAIGKTALDLTHRDKMPEDSSRWDMSQKAWERAGEIGNLSSIANPWAPTGSQRNLGNGDFNLHAPRGGPFRQSQISPEQILPSPQPMAPHSLFGEHKISGPPQQVQQGGNFTRHYEPGASFGIKQSADPHPQPPTTQSRTPGLPSPLAHSLSSQSGLPPPTQLAPLPEPKLGVSAWNSFSQNPAEHDAAARSRMSQDSMVRIGDTDARGQPSNMMITERWKQTSSGEEVGNRRVVGVQTTTRSQAPGPPATQSIGIVAEEPRQPPVTMPPQPSKSSKFQTMFKQLNQGPQPHQAQPVDSKPGPLPYRPASPPLPPPESTQHPAFGNAGGRPLVNLPGMHKSSDEERPVPVVRLPPPKALPQNSPSAGSRTGQNFLQGPAQPLAKSIDWQNRFRGLFGREKRPSESAEFSISKTGFDILSVSEAAAVNFPQPGQISPIFHTAILTTLDIKTIDEEAALFDADLHPGSTPPVCVPANKFGANWSAASPPSSMTMRKAAQYLLNEHAVSSCRIWDVGRDDFHRDKVDVTIRLPGMATSHTKQIDAACVKDSRQLRLPSAQQSRANLKNYKKSKEASTSVSTRPSTQVNSGITTTAKPILPSIPTGPQTWAKRVSQGVPQSAN